MDNEITASVLRPPIERYEIIDAAPKNVSNLGDVLSRLDGALDRLEQATLRCENELAPVLRADGGVIASGIRDEPEGSPVIEHLRANARKTDVLVDRICAALDRSDCI